MEAHFGFEDLQVYKKTIVFIDRVYLITNNFPKSEIYSLTSQFRRAANSIALNIGEGSGGTKKEFIAFIRIAFRSLQECVVCIDIAKMRNYITDDERILLRSMLGEISRMLSGLSKSLR
jgi:four helix bundle protein